MALEVQPRPVSLTDIKKEDEVNLPLLSRALRQNAHDPEKIIKLAELIDSKSRPSECSQL